MKANPGFVSHIDFPVGFKEEAAGFHDRHIPADIKPPLIFGRGELPGYPDLVVLADVDNPIHAFKVRGGYSAVHDTGPEADAVVVASSGNFGRGVSHSAKVIGKKAHVFLAETTPVTTVDSIREHGGIPHLIGDSYDQAKLQAIEYAKLNGYRFLDGVSWAVYRGNYGLAMEIANYLEQIQRSTPDAKLAVVLPVGIGSLMIPLKIAIQDKGIDLIAVEPEGYAKYPEVFEDMANEHGETFAPGCAVLKFPDFSSKQAISCPAFYTWVTNDETLSALRLIHRATGILAEGAGALGVAAVMKHPDHFSKYHTVVAVLTGANPSKALQERIIREQE